MNIIIFGGNFDPIHIGHINMARKAAKDYNAIVYLVPSPIGMWKTESASKKDKLNMLKLAIEDYPELQIDEFELNSGKPTNNYSIDTVEYFVKKFPNDKIYFLIGEDQAMNFHRWVKAKEISELVQIIYYPRSGYSVPIENMKTYHMKFIKGQTFDMSSTDIRDLSKLNLPRKVLNYIIDHELYFVPRVKAMYTEKRYNHVLSVARLACEIADANGLLTDEHNYGRYFVAGYLHDIAKSMSREEQLEMINYNYPDNKEMPIFSYHQFVGAIIAEQQFGINDQEILDAIRFHATGRADMSPMERIVYAADKLDPLRGYDSSKLIDLMKQDYEIGFVMMIRTNKNYLESTGKMTDNPWTQECFDYYLNR